MMTTTPYANSVFEQPWWLDIVAPGEWGEVTVKEGDKTVARLPYMLQSGRIVMPPLTQTLGPWIKPEYRQFQPGNTQLSKQKELISALLGQLPAHKSFHMTFDSANEYILPYRWLGYRYEPSFSYRLSDLSDLDALYANVYKMTKRHIKGAPKRVIISMHPTADMMLHLLDKTFEAQGRKWPHGRELTRRLIEQSVENGHGKLLIAQDGEGNLHSGAFLLYDEKVCYYLLGGSDSAFRSSGAQSLVLWESIRFASTVSKAFDFEGSNVEGIENFFRQFGGSRVINYSVIRQSLFSDCMELAKPRVKRLIGYKI